MGCPAPEHPSGPGGSGAELRVVDVLRRVGSSLLRSAPLGPEQRRLLYSILACRTPALGGQVLLCPDCGHSKEVFHSCRNRHCPNCQAQAQDKWIAARASSMLPVPHFHVVFTLPSELRGLCKKHPAALYALLLRSSAETLMTLGSDTLAAQLGVTVVLHTWTRELKYHPHAHCIVSAGGWDRDAACFRKVRRKTFLFPVERMKALFRARFLRGLRGLVQQGVVALPGGVAFSAFERSLPKKRSWVVYAQAPFGRFEHVLSYLGRYTHRVGISNSRLRAITDEEVTFATKDGKTCTLTHQEFALRYLQHALPDGFKKIRHYGLYASGSTQRKAALATLETGTTPTATGGPAGDAVEDDEREDEVWAERCCPHCAVPLVLVSDFPRPQRPPWRPP